MAERRFVFWFCAVIIFIAAINFFIWNYSNYSDEYIYSEGKAYSADFVRAADRTLSEYSFAEYETALANLKSEHEDITAYREIIDAEGNKMAEMLLKSKYDEAQIAKLTSEYGYTDEQALQHLSQLEYMIERLEYAIGYKDYVNDVVNNTEKMTSTSVFTNSDRKNIVKARNAFYGLDTLQISAQSDLSIKQLFADNITAILAVVCSAICGFVYSLYLKSKSAVTSAVKSRAVIFAGVLILGVIAMYITNIYSANKLIGLGDFNRPIQSVSDFISCPNVLSVGTVIAVRIIFITAACLTIYFCSTGLFLCSRKLIALLVIIFIIAVEIILHTNGIAINFFNEFSSEKIFAKYNNIFIFGEALSADILMIVSTAILLILSAVFAFRSINAAVISAGEKAEQEYIDEINQRYTEARLIRHDIKNHLAAVAMLMDEGDMTGARKYLGEISAELDDAKPPVKTGSSVLDALLFRKISDCKCRNIEVCVEFTVDFSDCKISDYDLCGIFGNIFDNAMEACEKLNSDRKITLTVKRQMNMVCIFCENRYTDINRDFSTLKNDKSAHGMGLGRVRRIAAKYGGTVDISAENGIFMLSVLLN